MELKVYGSSLKEIKKNLDLELDTILSTNEKIFADIEIGLKNSDEELLGNYVGHCFIRVNS